MAQGQSSSENVPSIISEDRQDNFSFSLRQALVGSFTLDLTKKSIDAGQAKPEKVLALTFELFNGDTKRKIDLAQDFNYILTDEFHNTYARVFVALPLDHTIFPDDVAPKSLYPNSIYRQTIFFDPPIAAARKLTLSISNPQIRRGKSVVLPLSYKAIRLLQRAARLPQENDFQIIGPPNRAIVRPGSTVHLGIRFPANIRRPDNVYIICPDYLFEDPGLVGQYDVRIPQDQPPGDFEVVVMAKWNKNDIVLSKSLILQVQDPGTENLSMARSNYVD